MKHLSISALALVATAGLAHAGSLAPAVNEPAPMTVAPAPVTLDPSWTGFYAGGQIITGDVDVELNPGNADLDTDGLGVHAGYLYDLGSYVLGAEVDYDDLDIDTVDDASVARLKAIAGYDAGRFMPYVTAGVAQLDVNDTDDTGQFIGLGLAYAASENIRISGEYLDHSFEDFDGSNVDYDPSTVSLRVSFAF